jgi:hypothetical protein
LSGYDTKYIHPHQVEAGAWDVTRKVQLLHSVWEMDSVAKGPVGHSASTALDGSRRKVVASVDMVEEMGEAYESIQRGAAGDTLLRVGARTALCLLALLDVIVHNEIWTGSYKDV